MAWTRDRIEAVWRDLERPRERPVKMLRSRFRKQVDLGAVSPEVVDDIAAVFVFWGALQVAEAWLMPAHDRRKWLGEARSILDDAVRASSTMELRRLAILDRAVVDFMRGLSPEPGAGMPMIESIAGVLVIGGAAAGPIRHDLSRDHFVDALTSACNSLAESGSDGIAIRTLSAALLGLGSTTSRIRDRIAWLEIAEQSPDASIAERCREERERLLRRSAWKRTFGRDHASAVASLLPVELSLDVLVLPERARDIVARWSPSTFEVDGSPYR
jgi:hypothetical protein